LERVMRLVRHSSLASAGAKTVCPTVGSLFAGPWAPPPEELRKRAGTVRSGISCLSLTRVL